MATDPAILDLIRNSATQYGVDPDVLSKIAGVESNYNPNSSAPSSSAKGLFQFTSPTWAQYGQGDVMDPAANADAGARFTASNIAALKASGIDPTPGNIYLAHFAGAGGARNLLQADPSTPASAIMGDAAVKANPFLQNMTAADVQNWAANKMGAQQPQQVAQSQPQSTPVPQPASQQDASLPSPQFGNPGFITALNSAAKISADAHRIKPAQIHINFPTPPGLARARALALAMQQQGGAA